MTHISKTPLEKDVYFQILDSFIWLLTEINSKDEMQIFLKDFFTKTERIMLAKRLAVALLVSQGYDTKIITQVLKVSTATVYRMNEWIEHGGKGLMLGLGKLARQEKMIDFWKKVDKFLDEFLYRPSPFPRMSKD